jgi:hypothetical protein
MGFTLDKVVPWGRSFDEYVSMFMLTEEELQLRILGCGDGPAAFNATLSRRGGRVISVDPLYGFDVGRIGRRIGETFEVVMARMRENREDYIWKEIPSIDHLGRIRMAAMEKFLADFEEGKLQGRYVSAELPSLPFADRRFDLALSSHFLFLYGGHLSARFHLEAVREMLRVAREVRIFPLLQLDGSPSPHLDPVIGYCRANGFRADFVRVPYEFQRGGNEMLAVRPL